MDAVAQAIAQGKVNLPEEVILAGFDELSPAEEVFVQILGEKTRVIFSCAQKDSDTEVKVRVYATPEQECQAISAEVLNTWNEGQKRLGIVFFEQAYFNLIKRCFEELTDREVKPQDALRYNLTMGTPLSEHPLFQTAMIPLRLLEEPAPNSLLSSLLCSPHVKKQGDDWDWRVKTALWNSEERGTLPGLLALLQERGFTVNGIQTLSASERQPLHAWVEGLERIWEALGFPVCRCETDTLAKEHLFTLAQALKAEAGEVEAERREVLMWFTAASQGIEVVEKTPEIAGIQVLNAGESRGIPFDRLWVMGTHGGVLPEPVRELSLLDPDERRKVDGGTVKGQWEKAKRMVSSLLAATPHIYFSRALSAGEDAPFLSCPLVDDEPSEQGQLHTVDLWKDPPQEWMRARWLREGMAGIYCSASEVGEGGDDRVYISLPQELRVTGFEELLTCPFKFFAGHHLDLQPLEESETGITPRERGEIIHEILNRFMRELLTQVPEWPVEGERGYAFLRETVDSVLSKKPDNLFWRVERLRLLGDDRSPGLLTAWLEVEQKRALEGWRFVLAEERFAGLRIGDSGLTLRGKVDRIDSHPRHGIIIWDYKTGNAPTPKAVFKDKVAPQLPAYLLALKQNLFPALTAEDLPVAAGYLSLKKASEIEISCLKEAAYWKEFLSQWEGAVQARIEAPLKGIYAPDPLPSPSGKRESVACDRCEYFNLCNYRGGAGYDAGEVPNREDEE
jgi:RecB family exonuclease